MLTQINEFEGITSEAHNALLDANHNVVRIRQDFDVWCHSAGQTCRCQSHDPGQCIDYYNLPIPACKVNFHLSPFLTLHENEFHYNHLTDTDYEIVVRFLNGDVLERVRSKHWSAVTSLIRAGHPTGAQLAQMAEINIDE